MRMSKKKFSRTKKFFVNNFCCSELKYLCRISVNESQRRRTEHASKLNMCSYVPRMWVAALKWYLKHHKYTPPIAIEWSQQSYNDRLRVNWFVTDGKGTYLKITRWSLHSDPTSSFSHFLGEGAVGGGGSKLNEQVWCRGRYEKQLFLLTNFLFDIWAASPNMNTTFHCYSHYLQRL